MKFRASSGGDGPRELPPAGTYKASLVTICDIGTQDGGMYDPKRQVVFVWQLFKGGKPLLTSGGQPQTISRFFTASFNEKATLRKTIESLLAMSFKDGEEFDLAALVGRGCRLSVVDKPKQNGEPGVSVGAIMPLDEDDAEPKATLPLVNFEISKTNCPFPADLPDWLQKKIQASPEWSGSPLPSKAAAPNGNGHAAKEFNEFQDELAARL